MENQDLKQEASEGLKEQENNEAQNVVKEEGAEGAAPKSEEGEVDYKAELERIKQEKEKIERDRDNYRDGLLSTKEQLKKLKKSSEESEPSYEHSEDQSDSELKREIEDLKKTVLGSQLENTVSKYASNDDEAELIRYHYENSIRQTGFEPQNIESDIQKAKALANQKTMETKYSQLQKTLESERTKNTTGEAQSVREEFSPEVEFTDGDIKLIERYASKHNISFDDAKKKFAAKATQS